MRVRGQAPVIWRCDGQSQVGAEPGHALVLPDLTRADQQLLDRLPPVVERTDLARTARCTGLSLSRARELTEVLRQAGVVTEQEPPLTDDDVYWDRLGVSCRQRARRLRASTVLVLGGGSLTWEVVGLLAEAGVGTILPEEEALTRWLTAQHPEVATCAPLDVAPTLVLSTQAHVIDPLRARQLDQAGAPHLPVTLREVSVRVGPLLGPRSPVCASCLDLAERDVDECWPSVATQLRMLPPPATERLLLHQGAALAARACLDVLTGARPWEARSVEVSALDPLGLERRWSPHPECLCFSLPLEVGTDQEQDVSAVLPELDRPHAADQ